MSDDIKKQLFILMAQAEEQQKNMDKTLAAIKEQQSNIENLNNDLPRLAQTLFKESLDDARTSIESDLNNHATKTAQELIKASNYAIRAADAIKKEVKSLSWKHSFITVGSILGTCALLILGVLIFVPSLDDILERRATVEMLNGKGGEVDVERCNGETCVRVMTKKCGLRATKDYCVVDFKD